MYRCFVVLSRKYFVMVMAVCCSFLSACSNSQHADLEEHIKKIKAMPPGKIAPMPEIRPYDAFVYNAHRLRSPFLVGTTDIDAPRQEQTLCDGDIKPDRNRRKEELEGFALESLQMVGTWKQGQGNWALIRGTDRQLHRALVGNYVGLNNGVIEEITDLEIKIREIIPDGQGCFEYRKTQLSMVEE